MNAAGETTNDLLANLIEALKEAPDHNFQRWLSNQVVCHLSSGERLRLATIILNELVGQQQPSLDQSDTWTEEDQIDLVNFSLNYAAKTFSDVEGG